MAPSYQFSKRIPEGGQFRESLATSSEAPKLGSLFNGVIFRSTVSLLLKHCSLLLRWNPRIRRSRCGSYLLSRRVRDSQLNGACRPRTMGCYPRVIVSMPLSSSPGDYQSNDCRFFGDFPEGGEK